MRRFIATLIVMLTTVAVSTLAAQQAGFASRSGPASRDTNVNAARELYATARYDEALALLNTIRSNPSIEPSDRKTIEQYRSLCLLALGREKEAETAIGLAVTADPFFVPTEAEASPRVRSAFSDVRARLLPDIASAKYTEAKKLFDRKDHKNAEREFRELLMLLDDPQMNGRLKDMRVLASGFLDLAAAAAAPPPTSKPDPTPSAPATSSVPAPVPPPPPAPRIYGGDEPGVVAPVAIRQQFPSVPASIVGMTKEKGILEVIIDEQGRVVSLTLRSSIHPVYDTMVVGAAREWKYKPATFNGKPVRYRKLIQVQVPRRQP
jgi:hypothetical protein